MCWSVDFASLFLHHHSDLISINETFVSQIRLYIHPTSFFFACSFILYPHILKDLKSRLNIAWRPENSLFSSSFTSFWFRTSTDSCHCTHTNIVQYAQAYNREALCISYLFLVFFLFNSIDYIYTHIVQRLIQSL